MTAFKLTFRHWVGDFNSSFIEKGVRCTEKCTAQNGADEYAADCLDDEMIDG